MKKWKWIFGVIAFIAALGAVGGYALEQMGYGAESTSAEDQAVKEDVEAPETIAENKSEKVVVSASTSAKPAAIKPLTKDEVLAKFPIDEDIPPYIDGAFILIGDRKETADYYSLADTDRYRNASIIFQDGAIVSVKFIPEGNTDPAAFIKEFGIDEEPRKVSAYTGFYEVSIIPRFWSQNIEKYPFELD